MRRAIVLASALALLAPAVASAAKSADHALYLAQRYAVAGDFVQARKAMRKAGLVQPSCPVVVKLRARGAVIPICAPSAMRLPARIGVRLARLRRQAAKATPALAAKLLRQARRLDPFDGRLVTPLVSALRAMGRHDEAAKVARDFLRLRRGRMVIWAAAK